MATFATFGNRNAVDANLLKTKALPAAGASASSDPLDIGPARRAEQICFGVDLPAIAGHVSTDKNVNLVLEHCDTADGSYVELLTLPAVAGVATTGSAAIQFFPAVPSNAKRYVRLTASVDAAAAGTFTGTTATLALLC